MKTLSPQANTEKDKKGSSIIFLAGMTSISASDLYATRTVDLYKEGNINEVYKGLITTMGEISLTSSFFGGLAQIGNAEITFPNQGFLSDLLDTTPIITNKAVELYIIFDDGTNLRVEEKVKLFSGIIIDHPIDSKEMTFILLSKENRDHVDVGTLITLANEPKAPSDTIGKIKPIAYGDCRYKIHSTTPADWVNYDNQYSSKMARLVPCRSIDGKKDKFLISEHELNEIDAIYALSNGKLLEIPSAYRTDTNVSGGATTQINTWRLYEYVFPVDAISEQNIVGDWTGGNGRFYDENINTKLDSHVVGATGTRQSEMTMKMEYKFPSNMTVKEYALLTRSNIDQASGFGGTLKFYFRLTVPGYATNGAIIDLTSPDATLLQINTACNLMNGLAPSLVYHIETPSLNDATVTIDTDGTYLRQGDNYKAEITSVTPDKFKWYRNGEIIGSNINLSTSDIELDPGVNIKWGSTSGHGVGASWEWTVRVDIANIAVRHEQASGGDLGDVSDAELFMCLMRVDFELDAGVKYDQLFASVQGKEYGTWINNRPNHPDNNSSGSVIRNPIGIIEDIFRTKFSYGASDLDTGSFDLAATLLSNWKFDFVISEQINSFQLLQDLCELCHAKLWWDHNGKVRLVVFDATAGFAVSGTDTPDAGDIYSASPLSSGDSYIQNPILSSGNEDTLSLNLGSEDDLMNDLKLFRQWDFGGDPLSIESEKSDSTSKTNYGTFEETLFTKYIMDQTTLDNAAQFRVNMRKDRLYYSVIPTGVNAVHLEPGDFINIRHSIVDSVFGVAVTPTKKWVVLDPIVIPSGSESKHIAIRVAEVPNIGVPPNA